MDTDMISGYESLETKMDMEHDMDTETDTGHVMDMENDIDTDDGHEINPVKFFLNAASDGEKN